MASFNPAGPLGFPMKIRFLGVVAVAVLAWSGAAPAQTPSATGGAGVPAVPSATNETLRARAKALELPSAYVPPPGDPLSHHAAGLAKVVCSAVFISGFDSDFAVENLGYFTAPYAERAKLGQPVVDRVNKEVHVSLPNGTVRTAKFFGDQGAVILPAGEKTVHFKPVVVKKQLPDAKTQPWPMGDVLPAGPLPAGIDTAKVQRALDAAFADPAGLTAAFVVTWKGRLIGERYGDKVDLHTPLEAWSMGKSLAATLLGLLIEEGVYDLWQPAPIPEWQAPGDPPCVARGWGLETAAGRRSARRHSSDARAFPGRTPCVACTRIPRTGRRVPAARSRSVRGVLPCCGLFRRRPQFQSRERRRDARAAGCRSVFAASSG